MVTFPLSPRVGKLPRKTLEFFGGTGLVPIALDLLAAVFGEWVALLGEFFETMAARRFPAVRFLEADWSRVLAPPFKDLTTAVFLVFLDVRGARDFLRDVCFLAGLDFLAMTKLTTAKRRRPTMAASEEGHPNAQDMFEDFKLRGNFGRDGTAQGSGARYREPHTPEIQFRR